MDGFTRDAIRVGRWGSTSRQRLVIELVQSTDKFVGPCLDFHFRVITRIMPQVSILFEQKKFQDARKIKFKKEFGLPRGVRAC